MHWSDAVWLTAGFLAQGFFSARFLMQWILSERAGRSLLPVHFWYFSVAGSVLLLAYAIHRRDPVIATGQVIGQQTDATAATAGVGTFDPRATADAVSHSAAEETSHGKV